LLTLSGKGECREMLNGFRQRIFLKQR